MWSSGRDAVGRAGARGTASGPACRIFLGRATSWGVPFAIAIEGRAPAAPPACAGDAMLLLGCPGRRRGAEARGWRRAGGQGGRAVLPDTVGEEHVDWRGASCEAIGWLGFGTPLLYVTVKTSERSGFVRGKVYS
jgi:hypothetical protein